MSFIDHNDQVTIFKKSVSYSNYYYLLLFIYHLIIRNIENDFYTFFNFDLSVVVSVSSII